MNVFRVSFLAAAIGFTAPALAEDFDGSKDLLCASLRAVDCGRVGECNEGMAEEFNIPQFFTISFADKAIRAMRPDQTKLDTPITTVVGDGDQLILQGVQTGRGWSAAISQVNGRAVVSVSGEDVAFAVFAACTANP